MRIQVFVYNARILSDNSIPRRYKASRRKFQRRYSLSSTLFAFTLPSSSSKAHLYFRIIYSLSDCRYILKANSPALLSKSINGRPAIIWISIVRRFDDFVSSAFARVIYRRRIRTVVNTEENERL